MQNASHKNTKHLNILITWNKLHTLCHEIFKNVPSLCIIAADLHALQLKHILIATTHYDLSTVSHIFITRNKPRWLIKAYSHPVPRLFRRPFDATIQSDLEGFHDIVKQHKSKAYKWIWTNGPLEPEMITQFYSINRMQTFLSYQLNWTDISFQMASSQTKYSWGTKRKYIFL